MTYDPADNTPRSGDGNPYDRKHLRVIPTPDVSLEPQTVPTDPTAFSSQDIAALLRLDQPTDEVVEAREVEQEEDSEPTQQPPLDLHDHDDLPAPAPANEELDDYELTYADGSTTPVESVKRSRFRRGTRGGDDADAQQLRQALAAPAVDIWAAHRDSSPTPVAEPPAAALDEPTPTPTPTPTPAPAALPPATPDRRRRSLGLALLALLLIAVLGAGVATVAVTDGGGGGAKVADHSANHSPSHSALTPIQALSTPTTSTTSSVRKVRKHHKKRHRAKAHKAKAPISLAPARTTKTVVQTTPPATTSTPLSSSTPADASVEKSTSSSSSSKSSSTGSSSNGALPDVQQTEQAP
jgi:hypothetical protein